jgi:hypothetical protein
MAPLLKNSKFTDVRISQIVGLETYKAIYSRWPSLYSYINYPSTPTKYFTDLVGGVVASSGLSDLVAGNKIRNVLLQMINEEDISETDQELVRPLIQSSYKIKYLDNTPFENAIWIIVTIFLSIFLILYLYSIGFWNMIFNSTDGVNCYSCSSIFDRIEF